MPKIKHKQTNVVEIISWHQWSTSEKYIKNRDFWKIVDYGEPVDVYERVVKGKDKKLYILDKNHAIRMIKSYPDKYYYKKHKIGIKNFNFIQKGRNYYITQLEIVEKHPIIRTFGLIAIFLTIISFIVWIIRK